MTVRSKKNPSSPMSTVRSTRRVKVPRTPNPYYPWRAAIVGLDPSGSAHGYCLMIDGVYVTSGWFYGCGAIHNTVKRLIHGRQDRPVIFVCEDWYGAVKPVKALCEERGRWRQVIDTIADDIECMSAKRKWILVNVSTWSSSYKLPRSTKARKAQSVAIANAITKNCRRIVTDDNEADAILIANFASKWAGLSKLGLDKCK